MLGAVQAVRAQHHELATLTTARLRFIGSRQSFLRDGPISSSFLHARQADQEQQQDQQPSLVSQLRLQQRTRHDLAVLDMTSQSLGFAASGVLLVDPSGQRHFHFMRFLSQVSISERLDMTDIPRVCMPSTHHALTYALACRHLSGPSVWMFQMQQLRMQLWLNTQI